MLINNLYLYSSNEVASNAIRGFYVESGKVLKGELAESYKAFNNEIFSLLSWLPLEKLYISVTSSDSLFYRFKLKDSPFEFMWEAFLDYDGEGNKGSTLQIYKNDIKQKPTFGDTDYIYSVINDIAFQDEYNTESVFEMFEISKSDSQLLYA